MPTTSCRRTRCSSWARTLTPAPQLQVLPGAGHFFHGRINELRDAVLAFMAALPR